MFASKPCQCYIMGIGNPLAYALQLDQAWVHSVLEVETKTLDEI